MHVYVKKFLISYKHLYINFLPDQFCFSKPVIRLTKINPLYFFIVKSRIKFSLRLKKPVLVNNLYEN